MLKKLFANLNPKEQVAMWVTLLFQPAFIPSFSLAILIAKNNKYITIEPFIKGSYLVNWLIFFGLTYLLPTLFVILLYKTNKITDLEIRNPIQRHIPYFITILWFGILFVFLFSKGNQVIHTSLIGTTLLGLIALFFGNFITKISAHTLSISAGAAVLLAFNPLYNRQLSNWVIFFSLSTILVSWARYTLKAHSLLQIGLGILIGCCHYFIYLDF
jgi:hypothetical protein